MLKPCLVCGDLSRESRCQQHRIKRPSSTARGYGVKWQRIAKAQVLAVPWCECTGCGIHPGACNATTDLTSDHVTPIASGGSADGPTITLCRRCNSSKKDRL